MVDNTGTNFKEETTTPLVIATNFVNTELENFQCLFAICLLLDTIYQQRYTLRRKLTLVPGFMRITNPLGIDKTPNEAVLRDDSGLHWE
ncbi:hypothetical protein ACTXT7_014858 [Hymenolepis weldensis]